MESALGTRCDEQGRAQSRAAAADSAIATGNKNLVGPKFYENKFKNDHTKPDFYQGVESKIKYTS